MSSLATVPAAPTPSELIARLKTVLEAKSDAELAHKLSNRLGELIPERTVANWKVDKGPQYDTAIQLLEMAGWLSLGQGANGRAKDRQILLLAEQLMRDLDEYRAENE